MREQRPAPPGMVFDEDLDIITAPRPEPAMAPPAEDGWCGPGAEEADEPEPEPAP